MSDPAATMPGSSSARHSDRWPFGLAIVLIALPNLLFLATHLGSGLVAAFCVCAVLAALVLVLRDLGRQAEPLDRRLFAAALAGALALCLLGGETHLFFANDDWLIRDAVLRDLVAEPWPVGYRYKGDATLLRAPLGMYLTPALVGKALGLRAAHGALLVQNTLLFGGLFYGFARTARPLRRSLAVLAVFLVFSGWDVVGRMLLGRSLSFGSHLEQWVSDLQFSAHVTQLFWVPNHAASGWAFVGAYLLRQRGALGTSSLIAVFGLCVFWSPLSMMGALPFLILAVLTERWSALTRPSAVATMALAGLGLIPVALYLKADAARVAHGWRDLDPVFVVGYGLFLLLELLPFVVILLVGRRSGLVPAPLDHLGSGGRSAPPLLRGEGTRSGRPRDGSQPASGIVPMGDRVVSGSQAPRNGPGRPDATARWTLPLALGLLLLVPLYQLGSTDFVMRASIPALALLALRVGAIAVSATGARRLLIVLVLAIGAVTPLYEVGRALLRPAFAISDCSLLQAAGRPPNDGPLYHYVARLDVLRDSLAGRILALPDKFLVAEPARSCWPDHDRMGASTPPAG